MANEEILNRRLLQGDKVIYPITQQQNVIGLQRAITDKLPIVSSETPEQGTYVDRQAWLDISENDLEIEQVSFPTLGSSRRVIVQQSEPEDEIIFPSDSDNNAQPSNQVVDNEGGQWLFPQTNGNDENDEIIFPSDETAEETEPEEEKER